MGRASNRKWARRALSFIYLISFARKRGIPFPPKPYKHRKFWRAFIEGGGA